MLGDLLVPPLSSGAHSVRQLQNSLLPSPSVITAQWKMGVPTLLPPGWGKQKAANPSGKGEST